MKPKTLFLATISISFGLALSVEAQQPTKQKLPQRKEPQPRQSSKQPAQPAMKQKDGILYSILSIERKGQSMPYGNAKISAPEGHQIVELKLRVKPVADALCCEVGDFELVTLEEQKAQAVWGNMKSTEATTFTLQFIAPEGARFKIFKVNGVAINVGTLASEKAKP